MNAKKIIAMGLVASAALLSSCSDNPTKATLSSSSSTALVFAFTTDYKTGELRWLSGDTIPSANTLSFNQDTKIVAQGSALYVLGRYGADNLARLDVTALPATSSVKYQVALGSGANPEDVVIVGDSVGWLALSGRNYLLRFNPATGATKDSIDITKFSVNLSSSPEPISMKLVGDTLCVAMQRLDGWNVAKPGLLALFNAKTGVLLDTLTLLGSNPQGMVLDGHKLYVANEGDVSGALVLDSTRSVDVVDLTKKTVSRLLTSAALAGAPSNIALDAANGRLYVGSYQAYGSMPVAIVKESDGTVINKAITGTVDAFGGLVFDADQSKLYIGDRGIIGGGLKVWENDSLHVFVQNSVLPMYSVAVVHP